ncbi:MAG: hypothetical protein FJ026_01220 [Chloroflexi bacterium]|nr:hypothetical protein [Chloroflexota bacterium]
MMSNMGLDHYPSDEEIEGALASLNVSGCTIPATQRAYNLGNALLANVVMLGALCAFSSFFDRQAMRETLATAATRKFQELNLTAFDEGFALACQRTHSSF